jgi:tetratricopeptide (TPR) repeat protein
MKDYIFGKIIVAFLMNGVLFNAAMADSVETQKLESKPYLVRGQEVTKLFNEYEKVLNQLYAYLDEPVREIDPELHDDLEAAQFEKEKTGYQVVPKISPKKEEQPSLKAKRPKPNHFSCPICERAIREELAKLEDVNIRISSRSADTKVEKKDFIIELAKQFITLKTTWRKIQRWINYNKVWQGKVASGIYERWYRDRTRMIDQVILRYDLIELLSLQDDQLFFDKASTFAGFGANANRDDIELTIKDKIAAIDHAIWTRTKFTKLPSYVKLVEGSPKHTEIIVPLYTDILDEAFLTRFIEIDESNWQAKIENHQYSVHVDLFRILPAELYRNDSVPKVGQPIDEKEHAARFPNGAALTTGGRSTHSVGSVVVLGPKEISEITLAHEFGHFLSFKDRYFRGYEDLGDDGYDLFVVGTNPNDIMSHPGSGKVLPQHFREIMDAVQGKNLTAGEYVNICHQHYRQGEYAKSIAASEKALQVDPGNFAAFNNVCASNIQLKQWDMAISACEKAISLNPNSKLARNNLTWARNEKDKSACPLSC